MNFTDKLKSSIKVVAPAIASIIGTPIAGVAVSALCDLLLGKSKGTDEELANALASASPEILLKLKQLDAETMIKLEQLEIDRGALEESYVNNARTREIEIAQATGNRDWFQPSLAMFIVIACFTTFILYMKYGEDISTATRPTIEMLMNNLITFVVMVLQYYFGSSRNSQHSKPE